MVAAHAAELKRRWARRRCRYVQLDETSSITCKLADPAIQDVIRRRGQGLAHGARQIYRRDEPHHPQRALPA